MPSLILFFAITYAISWVCFFAFGALARGQSPPLVAAFGTVLLYAGIFAPGFVGLALTARSGGGAAVARLLGRILKWNVGLRWFVFALSYMAAIKLAVAVAYRIATGEWPVFATTAWWVMAAAIAISTWVQAGEEVGWRGYALPRMAVRMGWARASLLLGGLWALWHTPLFFIPETTTTGQSLPYYVLQVMAISAASAWLYVRTNGSLLLPMILHASINNTRGIVQSFVPDATDPFVLQASLAGWLTLAVSWICALFFLFQLSRVPREGPGDVLAHQR